MIGFANQSVLETLLIDLGLAFSQYVVLRAGVFSVATVGLAGIGGYTAGLCSLRLAFPYPLALIAGIALATAVSLAIAGPLTRLRGIFQAVATLAFVLILETLANELSGLTGGSLGLNGIPQEAEVWQLALAAVVMTALLVNLGRTRIGRAFDAMASDETAAVSQGIPVRRYQFIAFGLSGMFAGVAGSLLAFQNFSVEPQMFGFTPSLDVVVYVALGGTMSVLGPIVGTVVYVVLPEFIRPLAEYHDIIVGFVLIVVLIYLPSGIADSARLWMKRRRLERRQPIQSSDIALGASSASRPVATTVGSGQASSEVRRRA